VKWLNLLCVVVALAVLWRDGAIHPAWIVVILSGAAVAPDLIRASREQE